MHRNRRERPRPRGPSGVTWVLVLALGATASAGVAAQAAPENQAQDVEGSDRQPAAIFFGVGGGFSQGTAKVSGSTGRASAFAYTFVLGGVQGRRRLFTLEVHNEPFEVPNPVRAEHFSSLAVIVSGYLGPLGLGLGYQNRSWGGEDPWVDTDGGIAVQFTLAPIVADWRGWAVSPDFYMRFSGGDEIATSSMGVRVMLGRLAR
jgi:hypothetical protein